MRDSKRIILGLILVLALGTGNGFASGDVGEVGALLVYPAVLAFPGYDSFLTVTNVGSQPVVAHVVFIDGDRGTAQHPNPNYCGECDFDLPLTGNDTEIIRVSATEDCGTIVTAEDLGVSVSCPQSLGMIVISLESEGGQPLTENVLLGAQVLVEYVSGTAASVPAIAFQGGVADGDRSFEFNGTEYNRFPRVVATDFLAPDAGNIGALSADLVLFTLGFERQHPPLTDCSVTGFDADENAFSGSMQFGCWTLTSLWEISPEFAYPNLGLFGNDPQHDPVDSADAHGWLQLNCRVDSEADGSWSASGGVHGLIMQRLSRPGVLRPPFGAVVTNDAAWSRILNQSVTVGDALTLQLSEGAALD